MLSIFTRNTNFVVFSPRIRIGEPKGALPTCLLCCVLLVLAVASAQAQGPLPPPGAWSNPVTTITGSQTSEDVTTNDGVTYSVVTNTSPVNITGTDYGRDVPGGYYTQPGFGFYWGSITCDLTIAIVYIHSGSGRSLLSN